MQRAVPYSAEFARIAGLPSREWSPANASWAVERMTRALCFSGGATLYPGQAISLYEMSLPAEQGGQGAFLPLDVGSGKALISLLAPTVLPAVKPMILSTAAACEATERERVRWCQHYPIRNDIYLESYSKLSKFRRWVIADGHVIGQHWPGSPVRPDDVGGEEAFEAYKAQGQIVAEKNILERYRPDVLVLDEVDALKNPGAGCTIRVSDYLDANPHVVVVAMSGTITKEKIQDYSHILKWTARHSYMYPLPVTWSEQKLWGKVLNVEKQRGRDDYEEIEPGALERFWSPELGGDDPTTRARRGYRRRLNSTPGVVNYTADQDNCEAEIKIGETLIADAPQVVVDAIEAVRKYGGRPDGWITADAPGQWGLIRQLSLGFYYRANDDPPSFWKDARKAWAKFCRDMIRRGHGDTEKEIALRFALDPIHVAWVEAKAAYKYERRAVWVSTHALDFVANWARENWAYEVEPGLLHTSIIWTEHLAFGQALAERTGLKFYQKKGKTKAKEYIGDHTPWMGPAIATKGCATGLNLQGQFSRNLITSTKGSARLIEQQFGRTHRRGQRNKVVEYQFLLTCLESLISLDRVQAESAYYADSVGTRFKYLRGNYRPSFPDLDGPVWEESEND